MWAKSKQVGCAFKWCDKYFGRPHPWVPGETVVTCDYYPRWVWNPLSHNAIMHHHIDNGRTYQMKRCNPRLPSQKLKILRTMYSQLWVVFDDVKWVLNWSLWKPIGRECPRIMCRLPCNWRQLTIRPQFSIVYTLIDHRNVVVKCLKLKWKHEP